MKSLVTSINEAFEKMKSPKFLQKEGLGGEIPFFIFPYSVKFEEEIEGEVERLIKRLRKEGVKTLHFNLYDVSIAILESKGGIEKMFRLEDRQKNRPAYFLKALQSALNVQEVLIPYIREKAGNTEHDMVFISGVGAVFPYIRSHVILNNLQSITGDVPNIMFYPGEFTGQSLRLFDLLKDDNYYRAYNLNQYQK